jgi:hypothetical protein
MAEKTEYHRYFKELSAYSDELDVYQATSSARNGIRKSRDIFIIGNQYYREGNYYIGIIRDAVYLLALLPLALLSIGASSNMAIPITIVYFIACILLGYSSYRWFSLARSEKEYDDKMSVSRYMTWALLKQIIDNQNKLLNKRKKRSTKR